MKRLFITLLCIVMVMTFAGCSGNWKDNAVAGWDNLANSLSKSQITKCRTSSCGYQIGRLGCHFP